MIKNKNVNKYIVNKSEQKYIHDQVYFYQYYNNNNK